ncbi:MAG: hypothetical protein R3C11_07160 [Planctomycetaceae bacterium]
MRSQQQKNLLEFDWLVSLLFWVSLLAAAMIFAALVLSPKLEVYWSLQAEEQQNKERLIALQDEVGYLQNVVQALQHDPEFQAELARIELQAAAPAQETEVLDLHLSIAAAPTMEASPQEQLEEQEGWVVNQNRSLVADQQLRNKLYLILAGLVLFSFVFLQDNSGTKP